MSYHTRNNIEAGEPYETRIQHFGHDLRGASGPREFQGQRRTHRTTDRDHTRARHLDVVQHTIQTCLRQIKGKQKQA